MSAERATSTTTSTTTTAAPEQRQQDQQDQRQQDQQTSQPERRQATKASSKVDTGLFIPPAVEDQIDSVEVEFVHDGNANKGDFTFPSGANTTERIQQGAPPHLIVVLRTKPQEAGSDRLLDNFGSEYTYSMLNVGGLRLNERNSIPLLPHLPAGDAPKTIAEGAVATG